MFKTITTNVSTTTGTLASTSIAACINACICGTTAFIIHAGNTLALSERGCVLKSSFFVSPKDMEIVKQISECVMSRRTRQMDRQAEIGQTCDEKYKNKIDGQAENGQTR